MKKQNPKLIVDCCHRSIKWIHSFIDLLTWNLISCSHVLAKLVARCLARPQIFQTHLRWLSHFEYWLVCKNVWIYFFFLWYLVEYRQQWWGVSFIFSQFSLLKLFCLDIHSCQMTNLFEAIVWLFVSDERRLVGWIMMSMACRWLLCCKFFFLPGVEAECWFEPTQPWTVKVRSIVGFKFL